MSALDSSPVSDSIRFWFRLGLSVRYLIGAYLDINSGLKYQGFRDGYLESTVRSTECKAFLAGGRCLSCQTYRRTLRKQFQRKQNCEAVATPKKNWLSSKTPNVMTSLTFKCLIEHLLADFSYSRPLDTYL